MIDKILWIAGYLAVAVIIGIITSKDEKTPEEEWEEFCKHPYPRSRNPRPLVFQRFDKNLLPFLEGMREVAFQRISKGCLSEKLILGFMVSIPDRTLDDYQPERVFWRWGKKQKALQKEQRYNEEIYTFGEKFIQELKEYSLKQGYDWEKMLAYREENYDPIRGDYGQIKYH